MNELNDMYKRLLYGREQVGLEAAPGGWSGDELDGELAPFGG